MKLSHHIIYQEIGKEKFPFDEFKIVEEILIIKPLYKIFKKYPNIVTNSREIPPNSIFVGLKGRTLDGNEYVNEALKNGACYAITNNKSFAGIKNVLIVDDALKTLQHLSEYHRKQFKIPLLAITGSNGKTTTRELVYCVLSKKFRNIAVNEKNINTLEGVPRLLLKITSENDFAVVEMGTDKFGNIKMLCEIAQPDFGLITNIGKAHTKFLKEEEGGVSRAKGEMFEFLSLSNGKAFVNTDISEVYSIAKKHIKEENIVPYNKESYNVVSLPYTDNYFEFMFNGIKVSTKLFGKYNLDNVLAAIAIGKYFGISDTEIKDAIESYIPENNRSEIRKIKETNNTLFLDCYNANPTSMAAALSDFIGREIMNKMLIIGDMYEIEDSDFEHSKIVEAISNSGINEIFLVGNEFSNAAMQTNFKCFKSVNELKVYFKDNKIKNRNIFIKGSNGIRLNEIIENLT